MRQWQSFLLLLLIAGAPFAAAEQANPQSLPPDSFAQWMPPKNDKPVWLYTMFGISEAIQAVGEYNTLGDKALTEKWAKRLAKDYKRLPEMVPEWKDEVELKTADALVAAAGKGDSAGVDKALHKLGTTCRSCHKENRAMVKLIYGTPDFDEVKVESSETMEEIAWPKVMGRMGGLFNRIRIAQEDGRTDAAKQAADGLISTLNDVAGACGQCHQDPASHDLIFNASVKQAMAQLGEAVGKGDAAATGQALQTIGGGTCGRCHGIHRTLAELREALVPEKRR